MSTSRFTLAQRIAMTIALLVGVFLVVGGFTAYEVQGIQTQARQTVEGDLSQLVRLAGIQQNLLQVRRAEKDISIDLLMKMERVPQRIGEWKKHSADVVSLLDSAIAAESDPALQKILVDARASQMPYAIQVGSTIRKIERQEILDQAIYEIEIEKPVLLALAAEALISRAIEQNKKLTTRGAELVNGAVRQLTWIVGLGLLFAVASGLVLGAVLLTRIRRPLASLTDGIARVKSGDLSLVVAVQSQDELGRMSDDFNAMVYALKSMVIDLRFAADSITGASSQIATGNLDLSTRTEQASASLQQAAASLSELTDTVHKTAVSARTANDIAISAAASAGHGGELVMQVVSSMEGIKTSSSRIADIIGVIDGIAFQTNILALNAAVEAARAGEQGRGFAVVAGEVRSLAKRSAEAAREIKGLIETSQQEVAIGSQRVQDAGSAMRHLVGQVTQVSGMIREITQAASTQSSGISQVNQSMAQLEQMTQQNAALVEQAAATSDSLKDQAERMAGTIRMFTVDASDRGALLLT